MKRDEIMPGATTMNNFTIQSSKFDMTEEELFEKNIIIVPPGESALSAVKRLKAKDPEMEVEKAKMSPLKDSTVIVYNATIDPVFIRDLWTNKNFYTITLEWNNNVVEEVRNAYLRENYLEEDIRYYVENVFSKKTRLAMSVRSLD